MKWIFMVMLLVTSVTKADDHEQTVHDVAHFGASFALTEFFYTINKKAFRMEPVPAFVFSAITTLSIGLAYKYMEPGALSLARPMAYNALGVLGAGFVIRLGE